MEIKVFVSQPMHGLSYSQIYNRKRIAVGRLQKEIDALFPDEDIQIRVVNPIIHRDAPTTFPSETAERLWNLGRSIQYMGEADVMLVLKDWDGASGCIVENVCWERYHKDDNRICTLYFPSLINMPTDRIKAAIEYLCAK